MVGASQLAFDIFTNVVTVALPGVLWGTLFYLAWEHGPFAESLGLGRRAFWLLLPGALLASEAILPIAPVSIDWVAVDMGGALFPLLIGAFALERYAPPLGRSLARFLVPTAAVSSVLLVAVLPSNDSLWEHVGTALHTGPGTATTLAVAGVGIIAATIVFAWEARSHGPARFRIGFLFVLTLAVLVLTFAGSATIPNLGIVEQFPYFLLPPVAAGLACGLLAPKLFPGEEAFALPVAFFATTVGVLLGADLLRQPPLYGSGPPSLYAIGGAGINDLVYISGLLALVSATATHIGRGRRWDPVGTPVRSAEPSPFTQLRAAFRAGVQGRLSRSLDASAASARNAAGQARRLLGLGPPAEGKPWQDLPVPGWVVSDHANLEGVVRAGTSDPREGYRAWLTARWLVLIGRQLSMRRFASVGARIAAFGIDLAVVTGPAMLVVAAISATSSGTIYDVAEGIPFTTAIVGFISVAFLYFVVAEMLFGTTVGKGILGIEVRDRTLATPDALSALVRNAPLAPVLTIVGIGGGLMVAIAIKGTASGGAALFGGAVPSSLVTDLGILIFILVGVFLAGAVGVLTMSFTAERQRIGDLWAGTWVLKAASAPPAGAAPTDGPLPTAGDRSG